MTVEGHDVSKNLAEQAGNVRILPQTPVVPKNTTGNSFSTPVVGKAFFSPVDPEYTRQDQTTVIERLEQRIAELESANLNLSSALRQLMETAERVVAGDSSYIPLIEPDVELATSVLSVESERKSGK